MVLTLAVTSPYASVAALAARLEPLFVASERTGRRLWFGVIATGSVGGECKETPHAPGELGHLGVVEGILQAQHCPRVGHLGEARGRRRTNRP